MARSFPANRLLSQARRSTVVLRSNRLRRFGSERPRLTVEWAALIGRVAEGDREAFRHLFEHFAPRIKGMMLKGGASSDDADEIAQETLLAVWRKAAQFDPVSAGASAWIYTIARNLRIDRVRRGARAGPVDQAAELDYLVDPAESADDVMARNDEAERVACALSSLSEEQSMAIRLSFIEERPHPEIANLLGIPLGTVKSRIRLAINRLRALLDEPR